MGRAAPPVQLELNASRIFAQEHNDDYNFDYVFEKNLSPSSLITFEDFLTFNVEILSAF